MLLGPLDTLRKCAVLYCEWRERKRVRKINKSFDKERAREASKPRRRRRSQSSSQPNSNATVGCPLLTRLPKEILIQIWQYVLGSGGCHYHLMHGRKNEVMHALCQFGNHQNLNALASPCCRSTASRMCCYGMLLSHIFISCEFPVKQSITVENVCSNLPRVDAALLRTCRQIYGDAALLLYSTNIFDVEDLNTFIYWSRTILPSHLAAVKALSIRWDINWPLPTTTDLTSQYTIASLVGYRRLVQRNSYQIWLDFWDIVATKMPGLRDLRVKLGFLPSFYGGSGAKLIFARDSGSRRDVNAHWVKPLLRVRGLKRFELKVVDRDPRSGFECSSNPHSLDDLELLARTKLVVEHVRHAVYQPSLT